jgi:hypothetical protein
MARTPVQVQLHDAVTGALLATTSKTIVEGTPSPTLTLVVTACRRRAVPTRSRRRRRKRAGYGCASTGTALSCGPKASPSSACSVEATERRSHATRGSSALVRTQLRCGYTARRTTPCLRRRTSRSSRVPERSGRVRRPYLKHGFESVKQPAPAAWNGMTRRGEQSYGHPVGNRTPVPNVARIVAAAISPHPPSTPHPRLPQQTTACGPPHDVNQVKGVPCLARNSTLT